MWHEWLMAGLFLIAGYFFGSFSTGYFLGNKKGHNIQAEGSGNIGTTNALRTMGKAAGALTFLGDLAKAFIPTLLVRFLYCSYVGYGEDLTYIVTLITGLGVFIGHIFPFYLHFKGGKGIAVSAAVIVATSADAGIGVWMIFIGLALFIIIVALTRYVSLGSLVVLWYFPIYIILKFRESPYFWLAMALGLTFLTLSYIKHAGNIKRLLNGTERKLFEKKKDKEKEEQEEKS
ncbi:MAG: glycerol-3-phosphate acyltransferase [Eubacterium sp.]|nr:glycerol-3-phosphate acyltransferase [Eubacterium sp.]